VSHEYVANLHMHTPYSDGTWYHDEIAAAALRAGLDIICITDHNVWVDGPERYYSAGDKRLLVLVGEEVHDASRQPQRNHLLVYNARRELAAFAQNPQSLIDAVNQAGGLAFLAHPFDSNVPLFDYEEISWVDWQVTGFTGLEIWNYMSSWAGLLTSRQAAVQYAFKPELGLVGPRPEVLAKWDELLVAGQHVVGIGNADAHGLEYAYWGLRRVLFPYEFLFRQINTHILTSHELSGELGPDRLAVTEALGAGSCFVGYDGIGATRGFRFTCHHERASQGMGSVVDNRAGVTLQVVAPAPCQIRMIHNGVEIGSWKDVTSATQILPARTTGAIRVEAWRNHLGQARGWIFSNPIYLI